MVNISKHVLVPKHELCDDGEINGVEKIQSQRAAVAKDFGY